MKIDIHTLYWNNGEYLIKSQKKVMDHFQIPVIYHNLDDYPHGKWMDEVLENSTSDIVGFFDNDCVPLNRQIVDYAINYVATNKTFIGTAQVSNHIAPYSHIFAAPCFFFICREAWIQLGKPSFSENTRSDVAEEVSYRAEEHKLSYKALYPTHFERESTEGIWKLSNYGYFGIGTVFANSIYHLYQGRFKQNADLFAKRCQEIIDGTFTTNGMRNSI
jgi:hypothetical protein